MTFAKMAAKKLGCLEDTNLKMVECMRKLPATNFENLKVQAPLYFTAFAPVLDDDVIREDPNILMQKISRGEILLGCNCTYLTGVSRTEAFAYVGDYVDGAGQIDVSVFEQVLNGFVQNHFGGSMQAGSVVEK